MTRRVNFEPQQRVDQPDAQAIASFLTQDIRRNLRQLVMGRDAVADTGRVLRGFAVEAEDPGVSPRVVVKLDLGLGVHGAFMGAVDQGSVIDWGQLAGDHDGLGNLEGSAQNLLDFTGQPIATYVVKVRTTFVPGVLDNRAFWNPAANEEFVKPTNTRLLPQWEVAFQGHSAADWVPIGSVDWNGATVDTTDITDLRSFPIEGTPRAVATLAERWSHASQDDADAATYGVADFDRDTDRGDAAGLSGLWEGVRALGRQVQDLKGGREGDLRFDWFSRPFAPAAVLAADPTAKQTKSLRTVDVITFTVADGVTEQGDFNGAAGLYDCLKFIEDNEADLPDRIHVLIKNRDGAAEFSFPFSVEITGKSLHIVGIGGQFPRITSVLAWGFGLTVINPTGSAVTSGTALKVSDGELHLENLVFSEFDDPEVTWIEVDLDSRFSAKNIGIDMAETGAGGSIGKALKVPSMGVRIEDSFIQGNVFVGGRSDPGVLLVSSQDLLWTHGYVTNTFFGGLVRTRYGEFSGADFNERYLAANHLAFKKCTFFESVESQTGGAAANGQVDISGGRHIEFDHCDFFYHGDQTCVWGTTVEVDTFDWQRLEAINIHDCYFRIQKSAAHQGTITGAGGVDDADGTGWAIALRAAKLGDDPVDAEQIPVQITIEGNRFGSGTDSTEAVVVATPCDAGCISLLDCRSVWVQKNNFRWWTQPGSGLGASDAQSLIRAAASVGGALVTGGQNHWIRDNFFGDWFTSGGTKWGSAARFYCVEAILLNGAAVSNNVFNANNHTETIVQRFGALPAALGINTCLEVVVDHNRFIDFRDTSTPTNSTCVGILGTNANLRFDSNEFVACGGANILAEASAVILGISFHGNFFAVGSDETKFSACVDLGTFGSVAAPVVYVGNWWDRTGGTVGDALVLDTSTATGLCIGNYHPSGAFRILGATPGVPYLAMKGYAPETDDGGAGHTHPLGQHVNFFSSYLG